MPSVRKVQEQKRKKNGEEITPSKEDNKKRKITESDQNIDPRTTQNSKGIKEDYEKLKLKYDNLMALRITEPEKHNEQLRKEAQKREEATNKLIEQLRQDKERLQYAVEQKKESNRPGSVESLTNQTQVAELELAKQKIVDQCNTLKALIAFYEKLSSIQVTPLEGGQKYECECFHSKDSKGVKFEISFTNQEEVEYAPVNAAKNDMLPAFLKESICFGEEELPVFLTKLLTSVYKRNE